MHISAKFDGGEITITVDEPQTQKFGRLYGNDELEVADDARSVNDKVDDIAATIRLSQEEAEYLKAIVGAVGGSGPLRDLVNRIYYNDLADVKDAFDSDLYNKIEGMLTVKA